MRYASAILSATAVAWLASACIQSNAPPVRTGGFGAAGRIEGGEKSFGISPSVRLGEGSTTVRAGIDPAFVAGINDYAAIEIGGSFAIKLQAMGWAGVRLTVPRSVTQSSLAVDFGIGGGAGAGGERCNNELLPEDDDDDGMFDLDDESCDGGGEWDGVPWHGRIAGGGYVDIGFAWQVRKWVAIYVRPRVQLSAAEGVPLTAWYDLVVGPQFTFRKVDFHFGVAPTVFQNEWQQAFLIGVELGVSAGSD